MVNFYAKARNRLYKRKIQTFIAILFFMAEMALMVWPVGWAKGDAENFCAGYDIWPEELAAGNGGYCQEFVPEYGNVKSIGIYFLEEEEPGDGSVSVAVSDKNDNVLFETNLLYKDIQFNQYIDLEMMLTLDKGESYYLTVSVENGGDAAPAIGVCGRKDRMYENKALIRGGSIDTESQLLTRYCYTDIVEKSTFLKVLILSLLTALGIAFGLPENEKCREIAGIVLLAASPCVLGIQLELLALVSSQLLLPYAMAWNVGILYVFELVLFLCTHSRKFTIVFFNLVITILYSANYFVYLYRGTPLRTGDFAAIGTAAEIVGNYSLRPDVSLALAWCTAAVLIVYGLHTGKIGRAEFCKMKAWGYAASIAAAAGILLIMRYGLLYTDLLINVGFVNFRGWDQYLTYSLDGFLIGTCMDIQNSRIQMPDHYSAARVEEILSDHVSAPEIGSGDELPHIILIMNESWADLKVLGNLQTSEDAFSFTNSLKENTVRGYVNASVLGGGTANSEFEVFTGCTMGFLPASHYAYQQWMVKPMDSLISTVEDTGYVTWSLHPEQPTNWNRKQVYQYLGFDHSLWQEDFEGAEIIFHGVSDLETFYKVEELYENRQEDEKLFLFDLTMQNHGGYLSDDMEKTVYGTNVSCEEADTFLTLMKETDEAFEQLIKYFSRIDEKVIICMFGDHQPLFSDDDFYESIYSQTEGLSETDKIFNQYKTPFIIWANYDIPEKEGLDISMNYLGGLLLETAHISASPYFNFLSQCRQEYPVITANGYKDSAGVYHSLTEDNERLSDYRMLQYNYLFDKDIVEWGYKK